MREASQRERAKGGSAYAEWMEPASESCMNPVNPLVLRIVTEKYSVCRR